ncbi:cysteinyl-tRNA synthetase [Pseudarthrobacter chlorophenolicus A6]|uniref:Cysteine--tRNA ligase n=1 Tax=Pseudarthrobacter chlorophenolicus (strain ATCC 700700 / DSM 12829 / CIP 107037 / JCM 12360 / KCTC 9906 / NCIMB 13794 / A6) TaxID=452863 RepID=SYC_PSECP|nr:cysteine--tRNA ligase [Pseudarthrobacter chlorophenolicus]B8HCR7.1 RecName: Full=Cysteine--tRNA ligase; AltName: Full=Cysteinyl-tRNA synthetase; Short=CysRS [Pseudarthrobacter chlorophenolicus A6]ACL38850.1 cysteinyl-tRNA synthetase [Pseudarthrobacter chlorophenolicus A6]SDR07906.1 cysteinyl-tRNA synthetase [Pseudarthrobacter chlorophenolicus]
MTLRFYDTASAEVRNFVPLVAGRASLYYCGATVQGMPHVGHIRSAIAFDQLTRWLTHRGLRVTVVRNVTDIDDKILAKSEASFASGFQPEPGEIPGEEWWALAYRYEQEFLKAYDALGVSRPTYEPRATGHIPEMHALIQQLIDRGHAYPALDDSGDVYFDVRSWSKYGALTRQNIDDMQAAADADPRGKRDPRDFALWKGSKEGEPATASWASPWGAGRPGWHLECSAMVTKYLGTEFDIHGGGLDLRFPHHENEMAQSQAAGHPFANFWMHNGMVTYEGEKMSKSIGNTISPAEMLELASPRVVRYYLGQAHYRSILDYRPTSLQEAAAAVERIDGFLAKAVARFGTDFGFVEGDYGPSTGAVEAFYAAMDDDLNVPRALAALHETVRAGNTALADGDDDSARKAMNAVVIMTDVLGLNAVAGSEKTSTREAEALAVLVEAQLAARATARAEKDWSASDAIRDTLNEAGVVVEDGADGPTWSLKRD